MGDWGVRPVPTDLARRYRDQGWWTDDTVGRVLADGLARQPDQRLLFFSDDRPFQGTFADGLAMAHRVAGALAARGVKPGDPVAFQLPNRVEAAATFWGAALLGAVVVPIVHFYGAKEVGYILRQSDARVLLTADRTGHLDHLEILDGLAPDLPALEHVLVVGDDPGRWEPFVGAIDGAAPRVEPAGADPSAPALIAYTSGTTADPKGVVHSHRSLGAEIRQLASVQPGHGRPTLTGAPVGHAIGMLGGLVLPVFRGEPIAMIDGWDPATVLRLMLEHDLTAGSGSTFFLLSLLEHPDFGDAHIRQMPAIGLGGSAIPTAVGERAARLGIEITRAYGSTEHPSTTSSRHSEPRDKRITTDGHPLPGVELHLEEDGEIWSRGPDLFSGYTDPALTAEATDGDGWYRTGDIGVMDDDGWLTITDRAKDVIIRGGENVSPAEVEDLLLRMPGVAEVAVVAAPDARLGEHGCAFIRPAPGAEAPDPATIRDHLEAAGLARQKWPEEIRAVADLPRTASGKVQKFALRDQLRRSGPDSPG
jgi:acyl-CoA synthetase (AMP-forming)/AMP-acid ligase II